MSVARVLVVDDDRSNCDVVARLLADRGYEVDTASDGESALAMLEQSHYDLAVLDYQMPGMDGVELLTKAKELRPELVGVFLTAYTTIDKVFPAIQAGAERVLSKPPDVQELLPLVERLVGPATAD